MSVLPLVYAPDPVFKKQAEKVKKIDDEICRIIDDMTHTMQFEEAVGIGANMVGILKRIIVVDHKENGMSFPHAYVNPEIIWSSEETQSFEEASICFPYVSAEITRPKEIKLRYLDREGNQQEQKYEGFLATIIQHEIDYLNGVVFLDHLSRMKRDILLKKMQKQMKQNPPHVHGAHCNH